MFTFLYEGFSLSLFVTKVLLKKTPLVQNFKFESTKFAFPEPIHKYSSLTWNVYLETTHSLETAAIQQFFYSHLTVWVSRGMCGPHWKQSVGLEWSAFWSGKTTLKFSWSMFLSLKCTFCFIRQNLCAFQSCMSVIMLQGISIFLVLIHVLVTRLDYLNALCMRLPLKMVLKPQLAKNTAVRLLTVMGCVITLHLWITICARSHFACGLSSKPFVI